MAYHEMRPGCGLVQFKEEGVDEVVVTMEAEIRGAVSMHSRHRVRQ